ncbi:MAG TPA: SufS family cysteine desulfurase [Bacilli bacterium]|nr:SufS family cysteine desulfurase [Acholeplasmataceae bacterium]HOF43238.1 SufS family cysteine desulfurase [Bacilli bacterium]HOR53096.1 SufS family cysteine desulfurase [Bacilli bacterium]HPL58877.1 SufS family cysteine desulfurase [Bacilli bacterium]HPX82973.1 SufS family cysteine desulfurase [Bacilli bacterium]
MLDAKKIRKDFPIYQNNKDMVYLDNAATVLKPKKVLDKMNEYYTHFGVNIHRGVYKLSYLATKAYEEGRQKVADFINASFEEIVYFKNASEALNFVALSWGETNIKEGDEIITSELEHHSSVLPWQQLALRKKAVLRYLKLDSKGRITIDALKSVLNEKTKVIALTLVSNVFGYITPIEELIKEARKYNSLVVVDAAQGIAHLPIDVKKMDCDFLAFSAHKALGPTGLGVLYGKKDIFKKLKPLFYGGDMIDNVELYDSSYREMPYRFEVGTPAIAEIIGLGYALDYLKDIGLDNIKKHEQELTKYALEKMKVLKHLTIYNSNPDLGIIAFNLDGVHPHDVATILDSDNVYVRAGHHCAQLIAKKLEIVASLRVSFFIYNDKEDIDKLIEALKKAINFFYQGE